MKRSIGSILLALWLIVTGLSHVLHFGFPGMSAILSVIAVAAGSLIILGL